MIQVWKADRPSGKLILLPTDLQVKGHARPVLQTHKNRYLFMMFPNQASYFIDFSKQIEPESKVLRSFPLLPCGPGNHSFKSIILQDMLYVVMTSRRPLVNEKGQPLPKGKEVDPTGRICVPNSQIYSLNLKTLTTKPSFTLIKLSLDNRPKNFNGFSLISMGTNLLFASGDSPLRQCFVFKPDRREVSKCNVYTGDMDRVNLNYVL